MVGVRSPKLDLMDYKVSMTEDLKFKSYVELSTQVCSLAKDITDNLQTKKMSFRDNILFAIGKKMYLSFECLVEDFNKGRAEAAHHLKTLIECFIYFQWVGQDAKDERARLVYAKMCDEKLSFF